MSYGMPAVYRGTWQWQPYYQGDHSPEKPEKVRELQIGQEKWKKVWEKCKQLSISIHRDVDINLCRLLCFHGDMNKNIFRLFKAIFYYFLSSSPF